MKDLKGHIYYVGPVNKVNQVLNKQEVQSITSLKYLIEKGVDILLASDMLSSAYNNAYDTAILVSGDGDFAYVIENIKLLKKRVQVSYFPKRKCWHLRQISDKFISLDKNFFEFLKIPK